MLQSRLLTCKTQVTPQEIAMSNAVLPHLGGCSRRSAYASGRRDPARPVADASRYGPLPTTQVPVSNALLEGPIAGHLLRLAWPILVVLAVQTIVGVAETYFVSFLGTAAIAGVALVFPALMLMTMMSN